MYKSASKFMKSQPASRFFRDHWGVTNTQEIIQNKTVMERIWESTKRHGLRHILKGLSDYELALVYLALWDEDRLDLQGIILAEGLTERLSGSSELDDAVLREEMTASIARAYDRYR